MVQKDGNKETKKKRRLESFSSLQRVVSFKTGFKLALLLDTKMAELKIAGRVKSD